MWDTSWLRLLDRESNHTISVKLKPILMYSKVIPVHDSKVLHKKVGCELLFFSSFYEVPPSFWTSEKYMGVTTSGFVRKSGFWKHQNPEIRIFESCRNKKKSFSLNRGGRVRFGSCQASVNFPSNNGLILIPFSVYGCQHQWLSSVQI